MQQVLQIHGGKPLKGRVKISGAKNETTKIMVASALFNCPITLDNVPNIGDVEITAELMRGLGATVHHHTEKSRLTVDARLLKNSEAIYQSTKHNRISVLLAGPLLHRFGKAKVQKPGGCKIGQRPLDMHLLYLKKMGVTIEETDEEIRLSGKMHGAVVEFPYKSVGATEGALLASVYADGETIIKNPANEPEIIEQIKILQLGGALIEYDIAGSIHITGVSKPLILNHPVAMIGDRVEAISYAAAALATKGDVVLEGVKQESIITALTILRKIGANIEIDGDNIRVHNGGDLLPCDVETDPHPAFATDFQQPMVVLLSQATGVSHMHETVFDNRFAYLDSLNELGGNFKVSTRCNPFISCRFADLHNHTAKIVGPTKFTGGTTSFTDLRAAFGLVMAGLLSKNTTTLKEVHHLLRGYDRPVDKLHGLGADLKLLNLDE